MIGALLAVVLSSSVISVPKGDLYDEDPVVTNVDLSGIGEARSLPKYLHERSFDDSYPDDAEAYYRSRSGGAGGCSAVRDGGFLYRNFDYPFDERAEFVVKMSAGPGRFASVGVAQVGTNLTEQMVTSGKWSKWYKALPGATVDGINGNGVCAEINVVDGDPQTSGWATNEIAGALHPLAAVRWVLDHATNAQHAAAYLAANIRFPEGWTQNFHYMVADETDTFIVENGYSAKAIDEYADIPFRMLNYGVISFDGPTPVYFPDAGEQKLYHPDGSGFERYYVLANANITNVWYTNAYRRETNPPWVSDLRDVLAYTNDIFNAWATHPKEYFRGKTNGGEPWWQTVHTSVYDIQNRVLRLAVQETDDWYVFQVPSVGKVKSVNGFTGDVNLGAENVGALPAVTWLGNVKRTDSSLAVGAAAGSTMTLVEPGSVSAVGGRSSANPRSVSLTPDGMSVMRDGGMAAIAVPARSGTMALTDDIGDREKIVSTNMTLTTGRPGRTEINADGSIHEIPDPAYWVHENPIPYIPSVITGTTTMASAGTVLTYEADGLSDGEYSWTCRLEPQYWTDVWYGYSCPSNIRFRVFDAVWILRTGNGQVVEQPSADFPPYKVMTAQVPLLGSYRMGSRMMVWTAAPSAWSSVQAAGYSPSYPRYETNSYARVDTTILRRDQISDWALQPAKPAYTPFEIGALPFSRYLTTKTYLADYDHIDCFGLGSVYYNASLEMESSGSAYENFFSITRQGGMASDWVPLITNTQYRAEGIRHRCYRTSFGTLGTFDFFLWFPHEDGTIATREWVQNGGVTETDPTVPDWAKQTNPPTETDPTVPDWAKEPDPPVSMDYPAMTNTVNAVKNLHWDAGLSVTWTNVVHNGHIYYVTVTNTNVSVLTP